MHTCPVCGYNELQHPPTDYTICPSCGTEFGYHDFTYSPANLRKKWIAEGARWHSRRVPKPEHWSPTEQLNNIGYNATSKDRQRIAAANSETVKPASVKLAHS